MVSSSAQSVRSAEPTPVPPSEPTGSAEAPAETGGAESAPQEQVAPDVPEWKKGKQSVAGTLYRQSFVLNFQLVGDNQLRGEGLFTVGANTRRVTLGGVHDPDTSRLTLREVDGTLLLEGSWTPSGIVGTYRRGKAKTFPLRLQ